MRLAWSFLLFMTTAVMPRAAAAAPGNAWHIPASAEPGYASMRAPVTNIDADTDVVIVSGNQAFGGGGNPGNQLQTGSAVIHRAVGTVEWVETQLSYASTAGNNVYYTATIADGSYGAGETVEYYLRIPYSDHDTTFVYGDDVASTVTVTESGAQQGAFTYAIRWPLTPEGEFVAHSFGELEARVYTASGHLELVGPDRGGDPAGLILVIQPLQAAFAGRWHQGAQVVGASDLADGLSFSQVIGTRLVDVALTEAEDGVIRVEVTDWDGSPPTATRLAAESPADEHVYGFGEKFNTLDQAGNTVHVLTADPPGDKGDLSYKVAPWFVSTRGYGVRLGGTAEAWFDMRDGEDDRWVARNELGALALDVVWGPDLLTVVERGTGLWGRPRLPPPWAFAPWMSSDHWRTGGEVRYVVERMVELGIPTSVFVFDSPWETAYNDFQWNMTQFAQGGTYEGATYDGFASVGDMMSFMRRHGMRVVVWLTPFINVASNNENVPGQNLGEASNYAEAAAAGHFVRASQGGPPLSVAWWKGTGSPVDFTSAAARAWFRDQLTALVEASDGIISGFKIDDGEGTYIPIGAYYSDGRTGHEMRNGYTVAYHETVDAVLGADGVLFSRSGFLGTGAYPAAWAGDNEPNFGAGNGLPSVLVAGLSAAVSGFAIWGHDVGGYQDVNFSTTPENLFMRWAQFGALSPIMQMHRQVGAGMQYPWSFGPDGLSNYRTYARLHTELFPYLYTQAATAATRGLPILRPLVLEFPDDPATWSLDDTYLFGDSLLVAPMLTNEQVERIVHLPAGTWVDWWTHEATDGPTDLDISDPDQSHVPMFVRAGAIIPRLAHVPQTLLTADEVDNDAITTVDDAWSVLLIPSGEPTSLVTYDDTRITLSPGADVIGIELDGPARPMLLELRAAAPLAVTLDGGVLDAVADPEALADTDQGWTVDGDAVWIKFAHAAGLQRVEVRYVTGGTSDSTGPNGADGAATGDATVTAATFTSAGDGSDGSAGSDSAASGSAGGCGCRSSRNQTGGTITVLGSVLFAFRLRRRISRRARPMP